MNTDSAIKSAVGFFMVILVGALGSAALGGVFAALIAVISPEFVAGLFGHETGQSVVRYAFAVGMIWGLFIGGAASGFVCFLAAAIKMLKIRLEYRKEHEKRGG